MVNHINLSGVEDAKIVPKGLTSSQYNFKHF